MLEAEVSDNVYGEDLTVNLPRNFTAGKSCRDVWERGYLTGS